MTGTTTHISDTFILQLIRENNIKGWELLYDKYAPVMYGVICTHTADRVLADEILISLFIRLKHEQRILNVSASLCACILRYAYVNTITELKKRGINYTEIPNLTSSLIQILCSQNTSIKKVSEKLKVSETDVKQQLQKEFFMLRSKNKVTNPIQQQEGNNEKHQFYD